VIQDESLKDHPLIITEGEFDALIAIQCGFSRVVSVPDGAPAVQVADGTRKYEYLDLDALRGIKEIILATDSDGPGVNLMNDLAIRLGRQRCKWVPYPKGCKDLNDAFMSYGHKGVVQSIARAEWCWVDGVYRMEDLPPVQETAVFNIGLPALDKHYNIRPNDFCVVAGVPGGGKTSFLTEVAARMALQYGWTTAFASFEQSPQIDFKRNLRTYFNKAKVINQSPEDRARADRWINEKFCFICPGDDDEVTLEWTLERCAAAVIQHGARMIVIDPWNEMDHSKPADMTLTEYTGFAIKQFKKFAKKYQVHLIVAAHPAKPRRLEDGTYPVPSLYDISDSAHWANKADVGVIIYRDKKKGEFSTSVRVVKSRYHDQIGVPGEVDFDFDPHTNHYICTDTE
jgi:twinkle protein